jgi:deoxyribodipyrimidine photolyase-like uncharacterized protein
VEVVRKSGETTAVAQARNQRLVLLEARAVHVVDHYVKKDCILIWTGMRTWKQNAKSQGLSRFEIMRQNKMPP